MSLSLKEKIALYFSAFRIVIAARKGGDSPSNMLKINNIIDNSLNSALGLERDTKPIALSDAAINILVNADTDDLYSDDFVITSRHLEMIRQMRLSWNDAEVGAPQVDLEAPYQAGSTLDLARRVLENDVPDTEMVVFLNQLPMALLEFCANAKLVPGTYFSAALKQNVVMDQALITLMPALRWEWAIEEDIYASLSHGEIAGPTVNPKRPYGDMTYYHLDIQELLDWPVGQRDEDGYITLSDEQREAAMDLHDQILPATQVFLEHAVFLIDGDYT